MKGWVYVISNKSVPELVKVGYTDRHPDDRAREMGGTGVPHPYVVDYSIMVDAPNRLEKKAHDKLAVFKEGKEWFRCSVEQAAGAILSVSGGKVYKEVFAKEEREEMLRTREENIIQETGERIWKPNNPYDILDFTPVVDIESTLCAFESYADYMNIMANPYLVSGRSPDAYDQRKAAMNLSSILGALPLYNLESVKEAFIPVGMNAV